jgi:hypothetical protein
MRRYLLGQLSEEEATRLEQEYFESDAALEAIARAEEDLIDDYLGGRLESEELRRFETVYLASPAHARRVEMSRELARAAARRHRPGTPRAREGAGARQGLRYGLAAAAVLVLSAGAWWMAVRAPQSRNVPTGSGNAAQQPPVRDPTPPAAPATSPRVFAVSISPMSVRSGDTASRVTVPADIDVLAVTLEPDVDGQSGEATRAVVRTVDGTEVWRGPAGSRDGSPAGAVRIEIPTANVPVDDYVIVVFATDQGGSEIEKARYFLQLRRR